MCHPKFDDKDAEILQRREEKYNAIKGFRVGDFVRFSNGVIRRISYIWENERGEVDSIQTSDGGSYYLGEGHISMSGSLYPGIAPDYLSGTKETMEGSVWFFHHNYSTAHNGVYGNMSFRVFECSLPAKE